jgi:hypothetical protein
MILKGFIQVQEYASSWSSAEAILDYHKDVEGLWCDVFPNNDLDKFLKAGYTLVDAEPGPLGERTVVLTRHKYNYLKEKNNG